MRSAVSWTRLVLRRMTAGCHLALVLVGALALVTVSPVTGVVFMATGLVNELLDHADRERLLTTLYLPERDRELTLVMYAVLAFVAVLPL